VARHLGQVLQLQYGTSSGLRYAFALSLLADLLSAGADCFVADSTVFLAWPNWNTSRSKQNLRPHLKDLRDEVAKHESTDAARRGSAALPPDLPPGLLLQILWEGTFQLRAGKEKHPLGMSFDDIFAPAIRFWSMPYRDREGRRSRFVLTVSHELVGNDVPVGILEACDGPPFHPLRDGLLGVTSDALQAWIAVQRDIPKLGQAFARRFERIYDALHSDNKKWRSLKSVYDDIPALERRALGRSKGHLPIDEAKQLAYIARLARAHRAALSLEDCTAQSSPDLGAIARVSRDLVLPRVSVEISVCGALPPFSEAQVNCCPALSRISRSENCAGDRLDKLFAMSST
jgi:hypothetical protein